MDFIVELVEDYLHMFRSSLTLVTLIAAACGSAPPPAPVAVTPAPAPAPPPVTGPDVAVGEACFLKDTGSNFLTGFSADATGATVCVALREDDQERDERCLRIEYATGSAVRATKTALPAQPPKLELKRNDRGVDLCPPGRPCVKLALKQEPQAAALREDGKVAAAIVNEDLLVFDAATGKQTAKVYVGSDKNSTCPYDVGFAGNSIQVATSVCAGPGYSVHLYTTAGKLLGKIGGELLQTFDGGWLNETQSGYAVVDPATARVIRTVEEAPTAGDGANVLGNDWDEWQAPTQLAIDPHTIVNLSHGGVRVSDPRDGSIRYTVPLPVCAGR
jgi:hypothetical protein